MPLNCLGHFEFKLKQIATKIYAQIYDIPTQLQQVSETLFFDRLSTAERVTSIHIISDLVWRYHEEIPVHQQQ